MGKIMKKRTDGMAIASLIFGIPALLFGVIPIFGWGISALALIFGIVSLNRFRHNKHLKGKGIAIAGTALGSIGLILGILMFFVVIIGNSDQMLGETLTQKEKIDVAVKKVLSSDQIISIDLKRHSEKGYTVSLAYYFEESWVEGLLVDDYLEVLHDASKLFREIFLVDSGIYKIEILAQEEYRDDYGHRQVQPLARTSMERAVYNKINWEGFEASSLDKITDVTFYKRTMYTDLKKLQDLSKEMPTLRTPPSAGVQSIPGAPATLCEDVKEECFELGECEVYESLKSLGQCS